MELFLLMLLLNRPALARLMWARDGRKGAPSAAAASPLQSALLGCLLCRRLACHPALMSRGDGRGLALSLRRTADDYEGIAARILEIAHGRDAERALSALEQPIAACARCLGLSTRFSFHGRRGRAAELWRPAA